jgi:hypothetical protein
VLTVLIPADQFADIFAARAVATLSDLIVNEGLEGFGEGNIYGAYTRILTFMANFGKT